MPAEPARNLHIAGHYVQQTDLLIDTHGAAICDDVWDLLDFSYRQMGVKPTLLERDFNIGSLTDLLDEVTIIRQHQQYAQAA